MGGMDGTGLAYDFLTSPHVSSNMVLLAAPLLKGIIQASILGG
jgi:hypothetical protein